MLFLPVLVVHDGKSVLFFGQVSHSFYVFCNVETSLWHNFVFYPYMKDRKITFQWYQISSSNSLFNCRENKRTLSQFAYYTSHSTLRKPVGIFDETYLSSKRNIFSQKYSFAMMCEWNNLKFSSLSHRTHTKCPENAWNNCSKLLFPSTSKGCTLRNVLDPKLSLIGFRGKFTISVFCSQDTCSWYHTFYQMLSSC